MLQTIGTLIVIIFIIAAVIIFSLIVSALITRLQEFINMATTPEAEEKDEKFSMNDDLNFMERDALPNRYDLY
jgi:hypothetical protein